MSHIKQLLLDLGDGAPPFVVISTKTGRAPRKPRAKVQRVPKLPGETFAKRERSHDVQAVRARRP